MMVGEYELGEQIGEGAMGTVYTGVHPLIGKKVAIKVLKPELCANQGSIDRFVQEAQAVNKISRAGSGAGRCSSPTRARSSTASRAHSRPRTPRTSFTATSSSTSDLGDEFQGAIELFKQAYELVRDPVYLFNIAQSYRKVADCENSFDYYTQYLRAKVALYLVGRTRVEHVIVSPTDGGAAVTALLRF